MRIEVASSHYNEDLSWTSKVKYPVQVFSKTIKDENFINFNKVQETPAYLKYIIKNWDNLPDYTFFVHGHEYSHHQSDSIINLINNTEINKDLININRSDWWHEFNSDTIKNKYSNEWEWIISCWDKLFLNYLPLPSKLKFPASAQFCVSKNLINSNCLDFYKNAYNWCENTKLDNFVSSRIFEYIWYYIFTHQEEFYN